MGAQEQTNHRTTQLVSVLMHLQNNTEQRYTKAAKSPPSSGGQTTTNPKQWQGGKPYIKATCVQHVGTVLPPGATT
jgi:hypothetical protein